MPYIVRQAVRNGPKRYKRGDFYPGEKNSHPDMEEVGALEWVDAPAPPPREAKAAKPPAKRKAVKP